MVNNNSSINQPGFMNAHNHQVPSQNNGAVMQNQPQIGAGNPQNQTMMMQQPFIPNMQPAMNTPPFMNAPNHLLPLQNNQLQMPHMGLAPPQNSVCNGNYNPMFHGQGQVMQNAGLSQLQGQILAQSILNMLQQASNMNMNMNMPNGQFAAPYPMQNMNQQLPMPVPNPMQNMNQQLPPLAPNPMQNMNQQLPPQVANPMQNMNQQLPPQVPNPMQNMNQQLPPQVPNPMQNMNQQLPPQGPNPSQVFPYGMHPSSRPMFGFPGQMPQAMVPQNQNLSANPQMGLVPGNQVRPQVDQNKKNMAPSNGSNSNAFASSPFSSQQLQGNISSSLNSNSMRPHSTNNSQPSAFTKPHSQAGPNSNFKTNVPNCNWKGSPSKNFKNKPNRGGFQGGSQKSKFHDINNGKRKTGFPRELEGKGIRDGKPGRFGLNPNEHVQEPKRSISVTYTEQEIQQWREARKKNHPYSNTIQKQSERLKDSKVIDRAVLQRELKEVLSKQAELGVEVAEIPRDYLMDSENQVCQREGKTTFTNKRKFHNHSENQVCQGEGKTTFTDKRKFQNKFNKRTDRKGRYGKKQKFADKDFSESPSSSKREPTLLEKLLSADIKRDKSYLLQVFRFMVMNSFFKDCPDKPLIYPTVVVKEIESEGGGKDALEFATEKSNQKIVSHDDNHDDSEDEDGADDENESIRHINGKKEPSSLVKGQCDNGKGIEKSDEEEGEIID